MTVKRNYKQASKKKRNSWCFRCVKLYLAAVLTTASLFGCGVAQSDQEKGSVDQTVFQSDHEKEMAKQILLKPGKQSETPDIPYSDQIDIIMQNQNTWCFTVPVDAEEYGVNESDYYYWVTDMNQNGYFEVISEETLRKRVEMSWDQFGIHVPNENSPDNPFFPETATDDTEVSYLMDMLSEGRATMQVQEELRGNDGILYLVSYCDPREVSNREGAISEAEEKKWVKKQLKEFYFYLWVTNTEIYYIPRFYPYEGVVSVEDLDDGKLVVDYDDEAIEDDYQKARLVFYHEIPEYALLVCQEEELEDSLKEMAEGDHQWIEKHGEDIRCYRSYTSRGEGYEGTNILQFVWKRGEGLIGVRYATHAAGGGGRLFWDEEYLKQEDVGFSIDNDTDDGV